MSLDTNSINPSFNHGQEGSNQAAQHLVTSHNQTIGGLAEELNISIEKLVQNNPSLSSIVLEEGIQLAIPQGKSPTADDTNDIPSHLGHTPSANEVAIERFFPKDS